jgi:2-oxoglutarate dehydrogenase E2 component (dihydrolipoamide succinyltransferase)
MKIEIKIPSPGESITEVVLATWFVSNGDYVNKNQELAEIESDKATLTLTADAAGSVEILVEEGETTPIGAIACTIDTSAKIPEGQPAESIDKTQSETLVEKTASNPIKSDKEAPKSGAIKITPLAKNILHEKGISIDEFVEKLHRISAADVNTILDANENVDFINAKASEREAKRTKMTPLRKKLSERLVHVKNQTAMLTTFNEVNMQAVMDLRNKYKNQFLEKHGIKLGFMSFFTRAAAIALQHHPNVNSMLDGEEIVAFNYTDIGIAVQTPKGLMVPIIRDVDKRSLAETELEIARMAKKARNSKISLDEMSGGTFTITNGGVFGSLLSTPIINPPQAGILGMHNIVDRPVAENGQVVIRPMMYIALSYDHRIIDGKDSVGFLVKLKELIEHPERMLLNGIDPAEKLVLG